MYYTALKIRGVEAVLVRVPDEPHGVALHPSHQSMKVMTTIDWFDRHAGSAALSTGRSDRSRREIGPGRS